MYVIYINDRPLYLRSATEASPYPDSAPPTHLTARYPGKRKNLLNYADTLEKASQKVTSIELVAHDLEALWADFRSHYKWIEAAGGIVSHTDTGKQLFIFRRGYWDLPKGKVDDEEDHPSAAVREVEEETGLEQIEVGRPLPVTYHTYRSKKDKRILKPTYWYDMRTDQHALVPEAGEGIEVAEWRSVQSVLEGKEPLYASLRALLEQFNAD